MPPEPPPDDPVDGPRVVVLGRYAGVVDVLADILAAGGVAVHRTAAVDRDGPAVLERVAGAADVVVLTLAPGDEAAEAVPDGASAVAVTWHPADERPPAPAGTVAVVEAGRIRADLADAVRQADMR